MMPNERVTVKDWGLLILRLGIGITFLMHGYGKLYPNGPAGFAGFLTQLGIPAPLFFAWIVALVETVGAVAVILGVLARWIALVMVIEMVVTITRVKMANGLGFIERSGTGWELDFLLLCAALAITLVGAGRVSVEAMVRARAHETRVTRSPR